MVLEQIFYFIITIGILVFVHEFGHFAAAKLSGMRVDAFAVGFGYRLFGYNKISGFTLGELPKGFDTEGFTDYRLCLLPIGGYVKIAGMVDESGDVSFANSEPKPWEFRSKSTSKKVFVITAGVMMNLILALVVFWGNNYFIGKSYTCTTTIGYIEPGSPADKAGLKEHDIIQTVNTVPVHYWEEVRNEMFISNMGRDLDLTLLRDNKQFNLHISRKAMPTDEAKGPFIITENLRPIVADLVKKSPADSAGLQANDVLLSLNGVALGSIPQTIAGISASKGQKAQLIVRRGSDTLNLAVVPGADGKIGIMLGGYEFLGKTERKTFSMFASVGLGVTDMMKTVQLTFSMIYRVFTHDVAFGKAFGGPIKIAQFAARSADSGMASFIMFLGLLSLSLAILNILPVPALDGGHLVIILIEGALKRELSLKVKIAFQNVGFALLLLLMAFIIYNDVLSL
ncbi:MAG: RIP metalloprotease RseP [Ignavibacteria bacterium]|nr:RIP metalloprotease RseP [Ignavibacteria bacterium]